MKGKERGSGSAGAPLGVCLRSASPEPGWGRLLCPALGDQSSHPRCSRCPGRLRLHFPIGTISAEKVQAPLGAQMCRVGSRGTSGWVAGAGPGAALGSSSIYGNHHLSFRLIKAPRAIGVSVPGDERALGRHTGARAGSLNLNRVFSGKRRREIQIQAEIQHHPS